MDRRDIEHRLRVILEEELEAAISDPDEQLDLDSFAMARIAAYGIDELGTKVELDDLDFDMFKSLNSIMRDVLKQ